MNIRVYGYSPHSHIDGPGVRMTIFFQGCLKRCEGCNNPDSWPINGGEKWDTEKICKQIDASPYLNGITFSGGEPFLQAMQALELARHAHKKGLSVWCYSGYTFEEILEWHDTREELLREIDVLVDGPFIQDKQNRKLLWRTSSNQRLIDVKASLEKLSKDEAADPVELTAHSFPIPFEQEGIGQ